jgi:hypothetical protein
MNSKKINYLSKRFNFVKDENNIVDKLMTIPKKEKLINSPTTDVFKMNNTHQIDLLYLPDDDGYKYALVVVDLAQPRYIGAMPLKNKNAQSVLDAILKIYKTNKYLKMPKRLEMDVGTEFQEVFKEYFLSRKLDMAYKKSGRSRQQACVESVNGVLAYYLFKRMLSNEISIDGVEIIGDWKDDINDLVNLINHFKYKNSKLPKKQTKRNILSKNGKIPVGSGEIFDVGDKVRVILDKPSNIQGSRENGTFRKTDTRWDIKPKQIQQISFRPNQPIMYIVDGINNVAYTKEQLQIVKKNEKPPNNEAIDKYVIESIHNKKIFKVI